MKIEGKNSVLEALRSDNVTVNTLFCERGKADGVISFARQKGVKISFVDKSVLDKISPSQKHQGYVADVTDFEYCQTEDIISASLLS